LRIRVRNCKGGPACKPGICISLLDTGSGIQPEHSKRLFEPFFSTKSEKGTGLGLWISNGIITKYEGRIRFRSLRLSRGNVTCFSVFLPSAEDRKADRTENKAAKDDSVAVEAASMDSEKRSAVKV